MVVRAVGIEPTLCHQNWILNPARLPVPPRPHGAADSPLKLCTYSTPSVISTRSRSHRPNQLNAENQTNFRNAATNRRMVDKPLSESSASTSSATPASSREFFAFELRRDSFAALNRAYLPNPERQVQRTER
jgi:hypothetical protein